MSAAADTGREISIVDGLRVETTGPIDAPALLFSAGLGGLGAYWAPQLEAFARDHRVIVYDHRGTGKSAREALPNPYSVAHLAADVLAVLDSSGVARAHLVGHAAGGIAALELARIAPDRVATVAVVNGWAVADHHFSRCFAIRRAIYAAGGADAYLTAQPLFLYPADWISEHLDALDAERVRHRAGFQDEATLFARIDALERFDIRDDLHRLRCPVLVVIAADDMLVPARSGQLLADRLPTATVARFPWGAHAVNVTMADNFNHALRSFLDEHRAAAH